MKGDFGDSVPAGSRCPTGKRGATGPEGPPGKIRKMGRVGACGGDGTHGVQGDKGDTGGVSQQLPIGRQGSMGLRGSQGATGTAGPKGEKGDPAVDIDIAAELCKHLPMEMVEQYRRGAYVRCAINSMEVIALHGAALVNTIIDKDGRFNATQRDVTSLASLSQTQGNSNYALNFHNDACIQHERRYG